MSSYFNKSFLCLLTSDFDFCMYLFCMHSFCIDFIGQGTDLTIYEKSTVYGGRCATRTSRDSPGVKYDTGAQYYSLKKEMKDVHSRWFDTGMTRTWFSDVKGKIRFFSRTSVIPSSEPAVPATFLSYFFYMSVCLRDTAIAATNLKFKDLLIVYT
jgi:NAD(P)-binding Rossmann-like domain